MSSTPVLHVHTKASKAGITGSEDDRDSQHSGISRSDDGRHSGITHAEDSQNILITSALTLRADNYFS